MEIIFNNYNSPKRDENTQSSEPVKPSAEKKSVTVSQTYLGKVPEK